MMKILVYLETSAVRGGIEVFAERHVAQLRAQGHEVEVGDEGRGKKREFARYDEIVVHKCSDVAVLEAFPPEKTVYYVHDHEPICPRGYAYTPLLRNCSRAGGVWPCVFCAPLCRRWKAALGRVFSQRRRIAAMARFRKIVVISEFMKSRLVANGIAPNKIAVEPPGKETKGTEGIKRIKAIEEANAAQNQASAAPTSNKQQANNDTQAIDSEELNSEPKANGRTRDASDIDLLYVGQLIRGKGVQLLLRAMAKMKSPHTLDIVGTGNMEPKLKALAARLGLGGRVRFNGFQQNPQDWMRRAACVVVPSFWQEPYGLVAAEAVALGRPVVAFAVGGLPEACQGKATLVPPGDIAALAAAIERERKKG